MRIRLRVPLDGQQNDTGETNGHRATPDGLRSWWQRLLSSWQSAKPKRILSKPDRRWRECQGARYLFTGRRCRFLNGRWQSEYTFRVHAGSAEHHLRIILPEPLVAAWEKQNGLRMPEEVRLSLVTETLEAMIGLHDFPATTFVSSSAIAAVSPDAG